MICTFCKKEFSGKRDKRTKHVFCGRECYARFRSTYYTAEKGANYRGGMLKKICKQCGKEYTVYRYRDKATGFCSVSCSAKYNLPECFKKPQPKNWTPDCLRNTEEYRLWRKNVYERDYWTCWFCGYKGNKIVAHHIHCFHNVPERRFDLLNGMTLCTKCHASIHACKNDTTWFLESLVKSVTTERGTSRGYLGVKLQSDLYGNMQKQAEMTCSLANKSGVTEC